MKQVLCLLLILGLASSSAFGAAKKPTVRKAAPVSKAKSVAKSKSPTSKKVKRASTSKRRARRYYSPWKEPTYADSTYGDNVDGEDLVVRRAAVEALGRFNGSVVVADPQTGRVLTIVNQRLALKSGFQPCSTVKIVAAVAGLSEGIIEGDTMLRLYGRTTMNLTEALARSNNPYFASVGIKLGFEKVHYYAKLMGLGEKAGLNIEGEQPGFLTAAPPKFGGVGMMTSFGEGIALTPLQLAALLSAVANGGTLNYLQYPRTQEEIDSFVPRVKRQLDIGRWIPEIKLGMMGAVDYGTARSASYDPTEPILGKTGTCTDRGTPTHLGWFGSFNDVDNNKLVVVVMLTGGRPVNGPVAAGIAGHIYRTLSQQQFFATVRYTSPASLVGTQACCGQ